MIILVTFVVLLVLGIAAQVAYLRGGFDKLIRRILARIGSVLITAGLVGLLLYVFEFERVQILTIRAAYLVLFVWFVWEIWKIYWYVAKDIPAIRQREREHYAFKKWLPKKKK